MFCCPSAANHSSDLNITGVAEQAELTGEDGWRCWCTCEKHNVKLFALLLFPPLENREEKVYWKLKSAKDCKCAVIWIKFNENADAASPTSITVSVCLRPSGTNTTIQSFTIKENQLVIDSKYCLRDECGWVTVTVTLWVSYYSEQDVRLCCVSCRPARYAYRVPISPFVPVNMRITLLMKYVKLKLKVLIQHNKNNYLL